jgi:dTDP-glucose 4,6-dehydratase
MRKILVTGGMGFIGSNFIRFMLKKHEDLEIVNLDKLTYAGNPANLADIKDRHRSCRTGQVM